MLVKNNDVIINEDTLNAIIKNICYNINKTKEIICFY